jgi:hypothetical protein
LYEHRGVRVHPDGDDHHDNPIHPARQAHGAQTRTPPSIQWHYLHETGVGIIIGLLFGFLAALLGFMHEINFNEEIFFYGLLPPMIFAGGYNLKKQNFGKNFKYILLFGFLGTIAAFGVIFGLTVLVSKWGLIVPQGEKAEI